MKGSYSSPRLDTYMLVLLASLPILLMVEGTVLTWCGGAGLVLWVGGHPDASFGFYLRVAFQS